MKKLLPVLLFAAISLIFNACGDEKEDPVPTPASQQLESFYENETDTHFMFVIDMNKDSSSIYMYNIVFRIGEAVSPAMTLRVDAPVTMDKSGKIFTYAGNGIVAFMNRGTTWVPMPGDAYLVNNLTCTVNTQSKTYFITFDCHGGHYEENGNLR